MREAGSHLVAGLTLIFFAAGASAARVRGRGVLEQGQNLTDGETLVSGGGGGTFTLGFFSPGSSKKRYLGIWFTVSSAAVCWVANRGRALDDATGVLVVGAAGSLLLLDGSGRVVWSSNSSGAVAGATSSVQAELRDSGNLVVVERSSGAVLWQSFDHPSDTLLPDMKVGKNLVTGHEWFLTSWRSADDPSPGSYRRTLDMNALPQVVQWQGGGAARAYRTGPWNGLFFNGVPEAWAYAGNFPLQVTASPGEITYRYTANAGAPLTRVVVNHSGTVERLVWAESSRSWETFFRGPRDMCDAYGKCGAFGLCDIASVAAGFCSCLRGFSPASPAAWSMRSTSEGCRRNVALSCAAGNNGASAPTTTTTDGFTVVRGVKLPEMNNAAVDEGITVEECRARCLANCSCLAYAAAYIRGGGCIMWTGTIVDLRYVDKGQDLYLRLAESDLDKAKKQFSTVRVAASVSSVGTVLLFIVVIWRRRKCSRTLGIFTEDTQPADEFIFGSNSSKGSALSSALVELSAIVLATNNFSDKLGEGGFGPVYKGTLPDGQEIAVKRLSRSSSQGLEEFKNEVVVLSKLQHRNLVRLFGCCVHGEERMLLYEYMPNNSLDSFIFDEIKREELCWNLRYNIIQGIGKGLLYLHQDSRLKIIHRDLKASNVLLDDNFNPKICDFGTARIFGEHQLQARTYRVVGTYGYISPEYAMEGKFSEKSDVFSFGVLILEIVCGRRNSSFIDHEWSLNLLGYAWTMWKEGSASELIDPLTATTYCSGEVCRCIQVGLLCVQELPDDRPAMPLVVRMLSGDVPLPDPKQAAFFVGRAPAAAAAAVAEDRDTRTGSVNQLTFTDLQGR